MGDVGPEEVSGGVGTLQMAPVTDVMYIKTITSAGTGFLLDDSGRIKGESSLGWT